MMEMCPLCARTGLTKKELAVHTAFFHPTTRKTTKEVCPDCGGTLRFEEGCMNCPSCGFSKC